MKMFTLTVNIEHHRFHKLNRSQTATNLKHSQAKNETSVCEQRWQISYRPITAFLLSALFQIRWFHFLHNRKVCWYQYWSHGNVMQCAFI